MMSTVFDEITNSNPDVVVIKVNVDIHQDLAASYGVMSIPTVYIYKDNQEINKFIGFLDKTTIENIIKS